MKFGSKYYPLYQRLSQSTQDEIILTLAEIEAVLGAPLPESAHRRRDWWGNRRSAPPGAAWREADYRVIRVDIQGKQVVFRKTGRKPRARRAGDLVLWDGEMVRALRAYMDLNQAQFADELGVRQQTVSEWETGVYAPSRATCKYLSLVAERAGFSYE
jgi:DNA-binding transcriptional regulator YiaG